MDHRIGWRLAASVVVLIMFSAAAAAKERSWTDKTGKFKVTAELQSADGDKVVLRRADGKEITVSLALLSDEDRIFVESGRKGRAGRDAAGANKIIAEIADTFYSDLRNQERTAARQALTKKAESLMTAGQSPLAGLPQPEQGARTIRLGDVKVDRDLAEIPVGVKAGGRLHQTKLHLRREGNQWRVFALSAIYPDGEKSINFEAEVAGAAADADPLMAIVGKKLELEGYTIEGRPLDMSAHKGKVVLVDFWATWCGPCRAEMPNIRENWDKHHDDGFEVVAISVDEDLAALQTFVGAEKPPWTVVADNHPRNQKSMAAKLGIRGIPAFILLGKDGKVAAVHCRGPRLGQQLARLLGNGREKVSNANLQVLRK